MNIEKFKSYKQMMNEMIEEVDAWIAESEKKINKIIFRITSRERYSIGPNCRNGTMVHNINYKDSIFIIDNHAFKIYVSYGDYFLLEGERFKEVEIEENIPFFVVGDNNKIVVTNNIYALRNNNENIG